MTVSITRTANPAGAGSGTTITYSTVDIGAADANRIVVVCVGTELAGGGSASSATINYGDGAIAMSAGTLGSQGNIASRIFYLPCPTGTTADIAITFGASQGSTTHHIAVYRVLGGKFSTESAVGDTDADPISSGAITIPTGGGCIAICAMAAETLRTWTGITEDVDEDAGTFSFSTGTSTTAGTPTITVSGANAEDGALSWLIFAPGYALAIAGGSYSVSGQAVTLSHGYAVAVDAGSYAVSGQDVTLSRGQTLAIDAGSYAVTGQDVSLVHAWVVPADAASYSIGGQDVTLTHAWTVSVDSGSYAITGQDVSLDFAAASAFSIAVDAGSYSVSGQDVLLLAARTIEVDGASYLISGGDVDLVHTQIAAPAPTPSPDAGGAGDIHPIRSKTARRAPRTYRRWDPREVTAAELREAAKELRAEARQSPLTVDETVDELAPLVAALGRLDRLAGAAAELTRAIDYAIARQRAAEQLERDDDEAAILLLQ